MAIQGNSISAMAFMDVFMFLHNQRYLNRYVIQNANVIAQWLVACLSSVKIGKPGSNCVLLRLLSANFMQTDKVF